MRYVIAVIFMTVFFFNAHISVLNSGQQMTALKRLSDSLELASHDAALQATPQSVSDGHPIFDQQAADKVFRQTIALNMKLDPESLDPDADSIFKMPLDIDVEQFIDYSNAMFPFHYVNAAYGIDAVLNGPSIVYAVGIPIPFLGPNGGGYIKQWKTIQAYPDKGTT